MILKPHTNLDWINSYKSLPQDEWIQHDEYPQPVRNASAESGTGSWEQKHWLSSPLGASPSGQLLSRHQGRWSFELLRPHAITGCCNNVPDSLVLLELCRWLKCQGGYWLGSDIFVSPANHVMHDGGRELIGVCVCAPDPGYLFKSQLPILPAVWL